MVARCMTSGLRPLPSWILLAWCSAQDRLKRHLQTAHCCSQRSAVTVLNKPQPGEKISSSLNGLISVQTHRLKRPFLKFSFVISVGLFVVPASEHTRGTMTSVPYSDYLVELMYSLKKDCIRVLNSQNLGMIACTWHIPDTRSWLSMQVINLPFAEAWGL